MSAKISNTLFFSIIILLVVGFVMISGEAEVKVYHTGATTSFYVKENMEASRAGVLKVLDQLGYGYQIKEDSIIIEWSYETNWENGFERESNKLVFTFDHNLVTGSLDRVQEFTDHPVTERNEDILGKVSLLYQEKYPPNPMRGSMQGQSTD